MSKISAFIWCDFSLKISSIFISVLDGRFFYENKNAGKKGETTRKNKTVQMDIKIPIRLPINTSDM